ncbi:hypothetical protein [Sporomusa sphaeroides]|uniref:Chromosome partition protein Smc n=1 Tax=Sporomusa sphaeroides DSM 2875 TaxID=1337886 RepID=A0ABP2CBE7_9FIRM|nr:hypothetical protein [Sporomusa sphaeroides]OLS54230.1 chromosome partition protein Smc [Sporomusa sphaeroides DSM 2875]CVK21628.1 Chromosome partition protein Smc [Sporomusa sphaeroides DSM 2875]
MEKILQQILDGQKQLFEGQKQLFQGQEQIISRLDRLETRMDRLETKVNSLEAKVNSLETRMDIVEGKLDENIAVTKALRHNNEEINAQLHSLGHSLAELTGTVNQLDSKVDKLANCLAEHIDRTSDNINFLLRKTAEHGDDIHQIRRAL